MEMNNSLDEHLATVIEVLLSNAGYQVVPTGIKKTIRELWTQRMMSSYVDLVHPRLRSIPDLFVLGLRAHQSWLTDVKFRRYIHPFLCDDLWPVQKEWAPFTLILAVAEPPEDWTNSARHIRVFQVNSETKLTKRFLLEGGLGLGEVFTRVRAHELRKAQGAILRIASGSGKPPGSTRSRLTRTPVPRR